MKVVQINCVYGQGSTGHIVRDLHHFLLEQGEESLVFYGRGPKTRDAGTRKLVPAWYARANNLRSRLWGNLYGGCWLSTGRLLALLKRERPDLVHLQCINGYFVNQYWLLSWLKSQGIPVVLTLHAEFPFTGTCAHALDCQQWRRGCEACPRWRRETKSLLRCDTKGAFGKMRRAFSGFEGRLTVVSVSGWLKQRAAESLILGEMCHKIIYNGVNTGIFRYMPEKRTDRNRIVFHATPMFFDDPDHGKGGWYVLELAKRMKGLPVRFYVAGKYKIRGAVPPNVTLLGEITRMQDMAQWYNRADVTLLTSRAETFSMVCAESLCCGTPVAGFQAGGPEEISLPEYSQFVEPGNLKELEAAVRRWLDYEGNRESLSRKAQETYKNQKMLQAYHQLYQELLYEHTHR